MPTPPVRPLRSPGEYTAFADVGARNDLQAYLELPCLLCAAFGRTLPWRAVPELVRDRAAVLWAARRRVGRSVNGHA